MVPRAFLGRNGARLRGCSLDTGMATPLLPVIKKDHVGHAFSAFGLPDLVEEVSSCDGW